MSKRTQYVVRYQQETGSFPYETQPVNSFAEALEAAEARLKSGAKCAEVWRLEITQTHERTITR